MGAWIETRLWWYDVRDKWVAPYVGAWIETACGNLCGCLGESHPTWVRGLKLTKSFTGLHLAASHPTWVRGLKL